MAEAHVAATARPCALGSRLTRSSRLAWCASLLLVVTAAGQARECLVVFTESQDAREVVGISLVDPVTGETLCESSWSAGELRAFSVVPLGDGEGHTGLGLVFQRRDLLVPPDTPNPPPARPPLTILYELDMTTLRPNVCIASLPIDAYGVTGVPWVGKVYALGRDAARAESALAIHLGVTAQGWEGRVRGSPAAPWHATLRPGTPVMWHVTRNEDGLSCVCMNMAEDTAVGECFIEGQRLWPSSSAVLDGYRAVVRAFSDPDPDVRGDEESPLYLCRTDGSVSRFATDPFAKFGPPDSVSNGFWVLTEEREQPAAVELRTLGGETALRIPVGPWRQWSFPDQWLDIAEGGRLGLLFDATRRTSGCILVVDVAAKETHLIELPERRIVGAVVADVTEEELADLRELYPREREPARELPWPEDSYVQERDASADRSDVGFARTQLGSIFDARWLPDDARYVVHRLPEWPAMPGALHVAYTVHSRNVIPPWLFRFAWLLSPPQSPEPRMLGLVRGAGVWHWELGIPRDELANDPLVADIMTRELLLRREVPPPPGDADYGENVKYYARAGTLPRVVTCLGVNGEPFECLEREVEGWLLRSWVTGAGTDRHLHLQAEPATVMPTMPEPSEPQALPAP